MIFYMTSCHLFPYFLILSKNPRKFPTVLPDLVQTKTNCILLFISLTACNVAPGIRVFRCATQHPWKHKIFPNIPLKSNSKNIFYSSTSDDELDHLLPHFTRAVDTLKVLNEKLALFCFLTLTILFELLTYRVAALTRWGLFVASLPPNYLNFYNSFFTDCLFFALLWWHQLKLWCSRDKNYCVMLYT